MPASGQAKLPLACNDSAWHPRAAFCFCLAPPPAVCRDPTARPGRHRRAESRIRSPSRPATRPSANRTRTSSLLLKAGWRRGPTRCGSASSSAGRLPQAWERCYWRVRSSSTSAETDTHGPAENEQGAVAALATDVSLRCTPGFAIQPGFTLFRAFSRDDYRWQIGLGFNFGALPVVDR